MVLRLYVDFSEERADRFSFVGVLGDSADDIYVLGIRTQCTSAVSRDMLEVHRTETICIERP